MVAIANNIAINVRERHTHSYPVQKIAQCDISFVFLYNSIFQSHSFTIGLFVCAIGRHSSRSFGFQWLSKFSRFTIQVYREFRSLDHGDLSRKSTLTMLICPIVQNKVRWISALRMDISTWFMKVILLGLSLGSN